MTASKCEFCVGPSLSAKFRLMEAAYHEDMHEVYERLARIEAALDPSEPASCGVTIQESLPTPRASEAAFQFDPTLI